MAQGLQQLPFGLEMPQGAELLPFAVDAVHLSDGRVQGQHFGRIGIDQGIDFDMRRRRFECGKNGGCQQHVAVVAQLDHQGAAHLVEGNGIGKIGFGHGSGFYRLPRRFSG